MTAFEHPKASEAASDSNFGVVWRLPVLRSKAPQAFTLVELLVVIAIMIVMAALLAPAVRGLKGASDVTKAAYDISGALNTARAYAMEQNTYVFVGFFEEDARSTSTVSPQPAGTGRIVISITASRDGNRYNDTTIDGSTPTPFGTITASNPVVLKQVGKLIKIENMHLAGLNTNGTNLPSRPAVDGAYQVGDTSPSSDPDFTKHPSSTGSTPVVNPTTFTYPLQGTAQYRFVKIIEFNPRGEASKILDYQVPWIEIALQPTHGTVMDTANQNIAVIQLAGTTGQNKIYRQ
ncbi:MAG: Tfp pilus assembly protein FimT/FimU [Chthoniobacteraceae bacterium]